MPSPAFLRTALACLGAATLGGCAAQLQSSDSIFGLITPYRIDIMQGNVVTKEQLDRVKPGINRAQVRELLGTPLVTDAFHADRWDYIFTLRRQGAEPQRRALVLHFDAEVLKRVEAPATLPDEAAFVASISAFGTKPPPKRELMMSEAERKALPVPARTAQAAAEPVGPTRSYPPLEP